MDRSSQFAIVATREVMKDCGLVSGENIRPERFGVLAASDWNHHLGGSGYQGGGKRYDEAGICSVGSHGDFKYDCRIWLSRWVPKPAVWLW